MKKIKQIMIRGCYMIVLEGITFKMTKELDNGRLIFFCASFKFSYMGFSY